MSDLWQDASSTLTIFQQSDISCNLNKNHKVMHDDDNLRLNSWHDVSSNTITFSIDDDFTLLHKYYSHNPLKMSREICKNRVV